MNTEITWFVWKWNKGAIHKNDFMFDHIVVSRSWIEQNDKAQGQVVSNEFHEIVDALVECDLLNNKSKVIKEENICDHVDCDGETEGTFIERPNEPTDMVRCSKHV